MQSTPQNERDDPGMSEGTPLFGLASEGTADQSCDDESCLVPVLHEEYEVKLELPETSRTVDLSAIGKLGESSVYHLQAVYFDTPAHDLARAGSTLRRRSGGTDAGWHLKIKGGEPGLRHEFQGPIRGARPPAALRQILPDALEHAPLIPVIRMNTTRVETPLLDPAGETLALISDDTVRVGRPDPLDPNLEQAAKEWREVEVERVSGSVSILKDVEDAFVAAGARPASYGSKLERALAEVGVKPSFESYSELVKVSAESLGASGTSVLTAGDVIMGFVSEQAGTIQSLEEAVAADAPDSVHKVRVATRRLRSALQNYARLFDADAASGLVKTLRRELRWYAGVLGLARDGEVLLEHVRHYATCVGITEDTPEFAEFLSYLQDQHHRAKEEVIAAIHSPRYEELQDELAGFLAHPPLRVEASILAHKVLFGLAASPTDAVYTRYLRALGGAGEPALWHEVRKRGKRARYFMDALVETYPQVAQNAAAWEAVTDTLGQAQDAHVAVDALDQFATGSPGAVAALSPLRSYALELMDQMILEGSAAAENALAFAVVH